LKKFWLTTTMQICIENPNYQPIGDIFSDLTLVLVDDLREVKMSLHRNILAWQIPYFLASLGFPEGEKKTEITLHVDEVETARLFFLTFYGYKTEWSTRQLLLVIKLKSYLCLEIKAEELYLLEIDPEDFPLFLQVIDLPEIEMDNRLLRCVKKNVPEKYSWQGVDKDFQTKILESREPLLVSSSSGGKIKVWNVESGECKETFSVREIPIEDLILSTNNRFLFFGGYKKVFKKWNLESGKFEQTFSGHSHWVTSLALSTNGFTLFSASYDKTIKEWDTRDGRCLRTFTCHPDWVTSLILTTDQRRIFAGCRKGTIKEWNRFSGRCLRTFAAHSSAISSLVVSSENKRLFSTSYDGTIKVWDTEYFDRSPRFCQDISFES